MIREAPPDYDPSAFPAFAVTVDVVILTMCEGIVRAPRAARRRPFEGMWAIPGGFKRPTETLDEAAKRELSEETGVDSEGLLTQFGAYGDPGRDPRMSVVTVAYLAVLRDLGSIVAGTDAAVAALVPVTLALDGETELAFDHAHRPRRRGSRPCGSRARGHRDRIPGHDLPAAELRPCTRPCGTCASTAPTSAGASWSRTAG